MKYDNDKIIRRHIVLSFICVLVLQGCSPALPEGISALPDHFNSEIKPAFSLSDPLESEGVPASAPSDSLGTEVLPEDEGNVLKAEMLETADAPEPERLPVVELSEKSDEYQEALQAIEGDWFSWGIVDASESEYGGIPRKYVHFEDGYADTYQAIMYIGKYERDGERDQIISICRDGNEYLYRLESEGGRRYSYKSRADDTDTLDFFGTWKIEELSEQYSGTGSLTSKKGYEAENELEEFEVKFED